MEGQTLSHYRVLEKLGGGGMGVVYKALDTHLDRHVAIKLPPSELTRDDDARERFVFEAKAASALDHPNICTIYDIDETPDGQIFIAMGYYEGETLKKRVERGPVPVEEALDIAMQMAQGLVEAHAAEIVHRDIKPANVMLTRNGLVKIVDFGIAKLVGVTGPTQTGTTLGTASYMSPEQLAGDDADQRTDLWALGVVLYEMVTGRLPFRGERAMALISAILNDTPKSVRELQPDLPEAVDQTSPGHCRSRANRAMDRRQSCETRRRPCHAALTAPPPTAAVTTVSQLARRPTVALPALVVLGFVAVAAFVVWNRGADAGRARDATIPEIRRLVERDEFGAAYALAVEAERDVPDDPILADLWPEIARIHSLDTSPSGADVFFKLYDEPGAEWTYLGQTPLEEVRIRREFLRLQMRKDGFETLEFVAPSGITSMSTGRARGSANPLHLNPELTPNWSLPTGMVRVPARNLLADLCWR